MLPTDDTIRDIGGRGRALWPRPKIGVTKITAALRAANSCLNPPFPKPVSATGMSFLSSCLTLLMTMDGTYIDNGPFGSNYRFSVPTGGKKRRSASCQLGRRSNSTNVNSLGCLANWHVRVTVVGVTNTNKFSW